MAVNILVRAWFISDEEGGTWAIFPGNNALEKAALKNNCGKKLGVSRIALFGARGICQKAVEATQLFQVVFGLL
jgi:hypothetical protein